MAIKEKLRDEEIALADIIRHPIFCTEFMRNYNDIPEDEDEFIDFDDPLYFKHTQYQTFMLCDFNPYVTFCTARAIGKTESLIDKITFFLLNDFWKDQYITFIAPSRVHLEPVFNKLRRWLQENTFLKHLVDRSSINSAAFTIKLLSGGFLHCRIAGTTGTGQNVVGLHTPVVLIDEAAYFPWGTWTELQPIINHWMEGFQVVVAGVPDGRRERSVLYYVDQKESLYTHHRITSHMNPRWNENQEIRAREQYGGENSEDYLHIVLGQHGSPAFSVFDRATMYIELYDTIIKELRGNNLQEDPQAGARQILELPPLPPNAENCIFGIDLGYTESTAIVILYLVNSVWRIHSRLTWTQIPYPKQEPLIAYAIDRFNPTVVGIDEGSSGKAVIQHLLNDEAYKSKKLGDKIVPINFGSTLPIGKDEEGKDILVRAKEHGMQYLQQLTNTHKICYSKIDDGLITELERTTFTRSNSGQLTFTTYTERGSPRGSDHNLAALLSGFLGWYLKHESTFFMRQKPKLFSPVWMFR